MYPTIFALGIAELGPLTSKGSGVITIGNVGGAVIPPLFGFLADAIRLSARVHPADRLLHLRRLLWFIGLQAYQNRISYFQSSSPRNSKALRCKPEGLGVFDRRTIVRARPREECNARMLAFMRHSTHGRNAPNRNSHFESSHRRQNRGRLGFSGSLPESCYGARVIAFGFRVADRSSFERARLEPCRNMARKTERL
jgi:hypothetical protein